MKKDAVIFGAIIIIIAVLLFAVSIPAALVGFIDGNLNVTGTGEFGGNVDMNLNYVLYMPLESWIHMDYSPGATDVEIGSIPAGTHNQDRHYAKLHVSVSPAPGGGKFVNVTLTDGTNELFVSITGAETSGSSTTGTFDLDVSAETLTMKYSQTAGGASTGGCVMAHWYYKENG